MPSPPSPRVKSFRFDQDTDDLIHDAAADEGLTMTEIVRRAVWLRSQILGHVERGGRLVLIRDPDVPIPHGFAELVVIGGL